MARLLTAGAESQSIYAEGFISNSTDVTTTTAQVRSGARSYGNMTGDARFDLSGALGTRYYARCYLYFTANPASARQFMRFSQSTNSLAATLKTDGTIALQNGSGFDQGSTLALSTNQWYRVELYVRPVTGSSVDEYELRVDGTTVSSSTTYTMTDTAIDRFFIATLANMYLDDIALNDDSGASQNTWPGDGKVVYLVPTALSAGGTGWTDDNASSTGANLLAAVDNAPPAGIADTTSGGGNHQDRNATSNANSNLDMTMTTYSAAGLASIDTINVITPVVGTAAPVSTSAKQGTVGVVSNPAISNVALGAGGTSGAFWSGTAAGTYPTGWKTSFGTRTYDPSVTVGTAPVMRVTQVTSSTRIAMVCFMGMLVDYTPGVAASDSYVGSGYYGGNGYP